jgi:hypothetical protein
MTRRTSLPVGWFVVEITDDADAPAYQFVEKWLDPGGELVERAGGRYGRAENPGYAINSDTTFAVGDLALCRPASGAGGLIWELWPYPTAADSPWKTWVRVATTVAGTLASSFAAGQFVDQVELQTGDPIFLKDQASRNENGLYTVNATGAPTRRADANTESDLLGLSVAVLEGPVNHDTVWLCTTNAPISVGVTNLDFIQVGPTGFPAELTSAWNVTTGYSWKQLTVTGLTLADASAATGQFARTPDGNQNLPSGTRGWITPIFHTTGWLFLPTGAPVPTYGTTNDAPSSNYQFVTSPIANPATTATAQLQAYQDYDGSGNGAVKLDLFPEGTGDGFATILATLDGFGDSTLAISANIFAPTVDLFDMTGVGELDLTGVTVTGFTPTVGDEYPKWVGPFTLDYTDFATAAMTNTINIGYTLPAGGVVHAVKIKHSQSFTGGAIASYQITGVGVGSGAAAAKFYGTAHSIFQATGATVGKICSSLLAPNAANDIESQSATTTVTATVTSAGANLDAATQGSVDIWLMVSAPPP